MAGQAENHDKIKRAERVLEDMQSILASLRALHLDMEDKKERLTKLSQGVELANYSLKLADFSANKRRLEDDREQLNFELQALTAQADTRARLQLKRSEVKMKGIEAQSKYVTIT